MLQDRICRRILPLVLAAASGAALLGSIVTTPARAEEHGWCLVQDDQPRCDYTSFQQCRRAGLGLGASCTGNPQFTTRTPNRAVNAGSR